MLNVGSFFSPPNINIKDGAFKKVYGRKEPNFWQSSAENFCAPLISNRLR